MSDYKISENLGDMQDLEAMRRMLMGNERGCAGLCGSRLRRVVAIWQLRHNFIWILKDKSTDADGELRCRDRWWGRIGRGFLFLFCYCNRPSDADMSRAGLRRLSRILAAGSRGNEGL